MKKLFSVLLMLSIMLVSATALADGYPTYLGGNRNYILFDGHQGVGRYVDRQSLNAEVYKPPIYTIAIDALSVPNAYYGGTKIASRTRMTFRYDWNKKQVYMMNKDGWTPIDPNGSRASGSSFAKAAEIAFALAYNMKFLGIYPNDFYNFMK